MLRLKQMPLLKLPLPVRKQSLTLLENPVMIFPIFHLLKEMNRILISQFTLKEVIRQTIFSIADNDNNKLMTGELFEIEGESVESSFSGWT